MQACSGADITKNDPILKFKLFESVGGCVRGAIIKFIGRTFLGSSGIVAWFAGCQHRSCVDSTTYCKQKLWTCNFFIMMSNQQASWRQAHTILQGLLNFKDEELLSFIPFLSSCHEFQIIILSFIESDHKTSQGKTEQTNPNQPPTCQSLIHLNNNHAVLEICTLRISLYHIGISSKSTSSFKTSFFNRWASGNCPTTMIFPRSLLYLYIYSFIYIFIYSSI